MLSFKFLFILLFGFLLIGIGSASTIGSTNSRGVIISLPTSSDFTDTNASTACSGTEYLAGNGSCLDVGSVAGNITDTDTNASTACSGTEVLLGNGSCIEGSYFDTDTNISDTTIPDTNASTACAGGEYLAGNGSCLNVSIASIDTNASTACSGTEVLLGNGSCIEGSYFDTDTNISDTNISDTNCSGTGDCSNIVYENEVSNLNVNSSNYWDGFNSVNASQFENNGGVLSIIEAWFSSFFDSLFGAKTTDDLAEGSTNLYDNQSWNQSHADTLYDPIGGSESDPLWSSNYTSYNASWSYYEPDTNISDTNLSESDIHDYINDDYVNITGDTMTGALNVTNGNNISIDATYFVCLNQACTRWIMSNSTGTFIKG